jgi:hypothetical protein
VDFSANWYALSNPLLLDISMLLLQVVEKKPLKESNKLIPFEIFVK